MEPPAVSELGHLAEYGEIVEALKGKLERLNEPPVLRHRLRRCISWLERAGCEKDTDTKCILLWVAFNAAYAIERKAARDEWGGEYPKERQLQRWFFDKLTGVEFRRIHGAIKRELWVPINRIMSNEYIFRGFWDSLTDEPFDWNNWPNQRQFEQERAEVKERLRRGRAEEYRLRPGSRVRPFVGATQPAHAWVRNPGGGAEPQAGQRRGPGP